MSAQCRCCGQGGLPKSGGAAPHALLIERPSAFSRFCADVQGCYIDVDPVCAVVVSTAPDVDSCTNSGSSQNITFLFITPPGLCLLPTMLPCSTFGNNDTVCDDASVQAVQAYGASSPALGEAAGMGSGHLAYSLSDTVLLKCLVRPDQALRVKFLSVITGAGLFRLPLQSYDESVGQFGPTWLALCKRLVSRQLFNL